MDKNEIKKKGFVVACPRHRLVLAAPLTSSMRDAMSTNGPFCIVLSDSIALL